jgi:hypothetical protein
MTAHTGSRAKLISAASDEYRHIKRAAIHAAMHITAMTGWITSSTPRLVATPFPPLKSMKTGKSCPSTAAPAARSAASGPASLRARYAAKLPFSTSPIRVSAPAPLPITRAAFVAPMFPLPAARRSIPFAFATISPNGTQPRR